MIAERRGNRAVISYPQSAIRNPHSLCQSYGSIFFSRGVS